MVSLPLLVLALVCLRLGLARRGVWPRRRIALVWLASAGLTLAAVTALPDGYQLRKFVGVCLMPTGIVWLALAILAWLLFERRHRGFATAVALVALVYTLAGNALLGGALLAFLERDYALIDPFREGPFDAVLVLGGGIDVRGDGEPVLTSAGDRVVLAARLFRAGRVNTVVASGPWRDLPDGRIVGDPAATIEVWRGLGVPLDCTARLDGMLTTADEIPAFKALVQRRGWRRVGLITSAWHLRRALRLCARSSLVVTPLPTDRHEYQRPALRWLVPQEVGFRQVQTACWELLGTLAGR